MELKNISYYFDLDGFAHRELLEGHEYVWGFLKILPEYIEKKLKELGAGVHGTVMDGAFVDKNVHLGKGSIVQPGAWVAGPAIIGENCEIRHGAYVGANTITGNNAVIGHASEVGNCVFLDGARAPHFAFVGHSVLGRNVNLGAGMKLSNLKVAMDEIVIDGIKTGLTKIGALIGDGSSLGCNSVSQPATFLGKNVYSYPLALLRGFIASETIVKVRQTQEEAALVKK